MTPPAHPAAFFREWLTAALTTHDTAHAMSLATATRDGQTSLRTVLLKAYGRDGFVFFTAPDSLKVRQLDENPHASLLFFWPASQRQVRIDGTARRVAPSSLARRCLGGARQDALSWVAPQGRLADVREALAAGLRDVCSILVTPRTVAFWQGGKNRRHATLTYERTGDDWGHRTSGSADLLSTLGLAPDHPDGAAS